ncbi:MAG: hypothetical protein EXQ90_03390 [Rhodospirillales bacterium]|nr:hypothetical protein [Rhodospirillales bacterium]
MAPAPLGVVVAIAALLASAACYYPARFDAEIEISRIGYYKITYDGYIADVPLFDGLRKREITAADETRKAQSIVTDLKRDRNTKEASYVRQGLFKINWVDEGDLTVTKLVTFLRRNENLLSIKYIQTTGQITVQAAQIPPSDIQKLAQIGLVMDGQLRVKTEGRVVDHNATRVVESALSREKTYVWDMKGIPTS